MSSYNKPTRYNHQHTSAVGDGSSLDGRWGHGQISFPCYGYSAIQQGTWANFTVASSVGYFDGETTSYLANNATKAQNDEIRYQANLDEGTYSFAIYAVKSTDDGVLHLQVDGVDVGTIDLYSVAGTAFRLTITGIAIATSGLKTIGFKMSTKNAASGGYRLAFAGASMWRTA